MNDNDFEISATRASEISTAVLPEILSPICDFIFKKLFGEPKNKHILIAFLRSVLDMPDDECADLIFPNPIMNKRYRNGKTSALDVLIKTARGRLINLEIQIEPHDAFRDRMVLYNDIMFTNEIKAGEPYTELKQTISIVIVDFNLFKGSKLYRHRFLWNEPETGIVLTENQIIHTFELKKLPKQADNSELCDWLAFLKADTKEAFDMIAQRNTDINEAYGELCRISADEDAKYAYYYWLKTNFDENARMHDLEKTKAELKATATAKKEAEAAAKAAKADAKAAEATAKAAEATAKAETKAREKAEAKTNETETALAAALREIEMLRRERNQS